MKNNKLQPLTKEEIRKAINKGIDESFKNHPETWALCNRMRQLSANS